MGRAYRPIDNDILDMCMSCYRILVSLFILAVIGSNIFAMIFEVEDWPFTNAPMFAHYVGPQTPRYAFVFEATFSDGSKKELGYYSVGATWALMRYYFKYVYGAIPTGGVFSVYPHDTPSDFNSRMQRFFSAFVGYMERGGAQKPTGVDIAVSKLGKNNEVIDSHLVGHYHPEAQRYEHLWKSP